MKTIVLGAAAATLISSAALAADPFADLYDNTATATSPDGKTTLYFINRDGTFENRLPGGKSIKGTYVWKDSQTVCFTVTDPAPKPGETASNCRPFTDIHHVGDTWTEKDAQGVAFTISIKAGR